MCLVEVTGQNTSIRRSRLQRPFQFTSVVLLTCLVIICIHIYIENNHHEFMQQSLQIRRVRKSVVHETTRTCSAKEPKFRCDKVSTDVVNTTVDDKWKQVSASKELYVYSAYYNQNETLVEVVAIAQRNTTVEVTCTFTFTTDYSRARVNGVIFIPPEHHFLPFAPAIIICNVGRPILNLETVSIEIKNAVLAPAVLRVQYPTLPLVNMTVCYPAVHSSYANVNELVQSIATNTLFGAGRFVLYDHSIHPKMTTALNVIVSSGLLELISWKIPVEDIHYYGQIAAAQDCLYRNRYTSKFIVFQDLDEFIVPRRPESWIEMMEQIKKGHPHAGSFVIRHAFFPKEWPNNFARSIDERDIKRNKLYILYKTTRHSYLMGMNLRSKVIVDPTRVKYMGIHHVPFLGKGFAEILVEYKHAYLHHYRVIKNTTGLPKGPLKRTDDLSLRRYTRALVDLSSRILRCMKRQ